MAKNIILNKTEVNSKIKRMAFQIVENNYDEKELIIAGINTMGQSLAKLLVKELKKISKEYTFHLTSIKLDPSNPLGDDISMDEKGLDYTNKVLIIVDDVANTGRTIFYAVRPMLKYLPKKIQTAVLIDRDHKTFPIHADYVGLSLSTTLKDHIDVKLGEDCAVYLS